MAWVVRTPRSCPLPSATDRRAPREHVLRFYRRDDELSGIVVDHLAGALDVGGITVIAATPSHLASFRTELARAGYDVAALRAVGDLVEIDAAELAQIFAEVGVDQALFDRAIRRPIERAAASGREIRVFGEIVALLWEAGEVTAVLDLERCWNELGAAFGFSLLCGVAEHTARRPGYAPALAQWCGLHSGVDGLDRIAGPAGGWFGDTATATFEADPKAPREARRFVAGVLARWRADVPIDETMCVVSELAANAVLHARTPFSLRLTYRPAVIRVEVQDDAGAMPTPRAAPPTASGGRGLRIVEALAARWGFEPLEEGGKVVWAELELADHERLSAGGSTTD